MADRANEEPPSGVDAHGVTAWLRARVPTLAEPLSFDRIAGGHSNITMCVTDAEGRRWVLRRPPLGHVLATAHDMGREHRIISALAATDVPVPPVVGHCDDLDVNGAPFYVMDFVDGRVIRTPGDAETLTLEERAATGEDLVDVLARIHRVDVDAVGLGDLGRRDGYLERQLKRWNEQYLRSGRDDIPDLGDIHQRLLDAAPPQQAATIVHGDYRLDNCMLGAGGRIAAVLDWEICTLGDPLADVGLLLVYWGDPDGPRSMLNQPPTLVEGFGGRDEVLARYAAQSDLDLSHIAYYEAFGYWKLACIVTGVYTRYVEGAMGQSGDADAFRPFLDFLESLATAARDAVGSVT